MDKRENYKIPFNISSQNEFLKNHDLFVPKIDLSYRMFSQLNMNEIDLNQSLFNGSTFRSMKILNSNFSRSDFEGTRFENNKFYNVDFRNCDIRSTIFSNCTFEKCIFNCSFIDDSYFYGCLFINIDFSSTVFSNSIVENTTIENSLFNKSTNIMNVFKRVKFKKVILGDCTFKHNIVKECQFKHSKTNIDSLGYLYGLEYKDLNDLKFIFLGREKTATIDDKFLKQIQQDFLDRKWYLSVAILRLNFNLTSPYTAIIEFAIVIRKMIVNNTIIKRDDLSFLYNVILELKKENRLPISALYIFTEIIEQTVNSLSTNVNEYESKNKKTINSFYNKINLLILEAMDELSLLFPEENEEVLVTLKFTKKPKFNICEFVNNLNLIMEKEELPPSKLIKVTSGSYIETIQTTLLSVFALSVFLKGLNGSIKELIKLRVGTSILFSKKIPKSSYRKLILSSKEEKTISIINKIFKKIPMNDIVKSCDYKGLTNSNIEDIFVEKKESK